MQTQKQKQSRSNASRTGNALSVSSTSGTRVSAKASTRTKSSQSSLENNTCGNSLAQEQELFLTEGSRASCQHDDAAGADCYSSKAKAVIAIWSEIAVSSRLGFLPVDLYTQATANAIAKYEDDLPAVRSLFEHAVQRERNKRTSWSKNLCRVLNDALSGSHWFDDYDYSVNRNTHIAVDKSENGLSHDHHTSTR